MKARLWISEQGGVELDGRIEERHRGRSYALLTGPGLGMDELRVLRSGGDGERDPGERLSDLLSKAMLFPLFVAGAYSEPGVHQALHSRVSRD